MIRYVYIYMKDLSLKKSFLHFLESNNHYAINSFEFNENIIVIEEEYSSYNELINYQDYFEKFNDELKTKISFLTINSGITVTNHQLISNFLTKTYCNVYDLSHLLYYCIYESPHNSLLKHFQNYLETLDRELLLCVYSLLKNNLNSLQTSRDLYLHRNSLRYRLQKFTFLTGIDPTTITGASIMNYYRLQNKYTFIK